MIFNRTEKEEKAYLMDIIALLAANIEQMDKAIEDKSKDGAKVRAYMQSQSLLLPAIQTIHKITNARTGYHKQSHEINPH